MKNCWETLGIEETCDIEEIKKAYRELIKRYHPDTVQSTEKKRSYTDKVVKINNAYNEALEYAESVNSEIEFEEIDDIDNQYESPLKTEPSQTPTPEELWRKMVESLADIKPIPRSKVTIFFDNFPWAFPLIFNISLISLYAVVNILTNWYNFHTYDKAIELNPKDAKAYYSRGDAYTDKGDYDKAIKDYDKAIELNPEDAEAYLNRGVAYEKKGNYDQAINDYDRVIAFYTRQAENDDEINLNEILANTYAIRGNAYYEKGNYDHAITDLDKAIELNPEEEAAYYTRGNAYEKKGNDKKAKEDLKKAADLEDSGEENFIDY